MIETMLKIVKKKEYQPGYPNANGVPSTWCNHAAVEIAETFYFDTKPLLNPKGIGWTSANDMYRNARKAVLRKEVEEVAESMTTVLANKEEIVFVMAFSLTGGSGHVAVVAPETFPYEKGKGCAIVQAGEFCGRANRADIFDVPNLTPPMFIKLRRKK